MRSGYPRRAGRSSGCGRSANWSPPPPDKADPGLAPGPARHYCRSGMRAAFLASTLALALAVCAAITLAAAPGDPQAASQQPLTIMRVGDALDRIGPALQDVPVLVADTGLA